MTRLGAHKEPRAEPAALLTLRTDRRIQPYTPGLHRRDCRPATDRGCPSPPPHAYKRHNEETPPPRARDARHPVGRCRSGQRRRAYRHRYHADKHAHPRGRQPPRPRGHLPRHPQGAVPVDHHPRRRLPPPPISPAARALPASPGEITAKDVRKSEKRRGPTRGMPPQARSAPSGLLAVVRRAVSPDDRPVGASP